MISIDVISAANFVAEPRDLFETRLPTHLRGHCPHVFKHPSGGEGWAWTSGVPQRAFGWDFADEIAKQGREPHWTYAQIPGAAIDPAAHLDSMRGAGVDAVVVYPLGLTDGYFRLGPEVRRAAIAVFNDWMAQEFEAHDRERIIGPRLLPSEDAPRGLLRALDHLDGNVRAVYLPSVPSLGQADGLAFWRDVIDADLTVCVARPAGDEQGPWLAEISHLLEAHPMLRLVSVPIAPASQSTATLFDAFSPSGSPMYCANFPRQLVPPPANRELASSHALRAFRFSGTSSAKKEPFRSRLRVRELILTQSRAAAETHIPLPAIGVALASSDIHRASARNLAESARNMEEAGFAGVWVGDAVARRSTSRSLDPFAVLAIAAAVTEKIELGTAIVQVPLRRRVELAHRALSLHQLASGRFVFGVGAGSTRADFDAVGVPFESRFEELRAAVPDMKALWRGDQVGEACLYPATNVQGGPPLLVGSWGGPWVEIAAKEADGWIASGTRTWRSLENAMTRFRAAGGTRAVISTVFADLSVEGEPVDDDDRVHLACPPEEAVRRLTRLAAMGFTDVVVFNLGPPDSLSVLASLSNRSVSPRA